MVYWKEIIIDPEKLSQYLLSPLHPIGKVKAKFFGSLGFSAENARMFEEGLRKVARYGMVEEREKSPYGEKILIVGDIKGPSGKSALIKTIWIVESSQRIRLVTAYPS
jgi:hypothetical protein